MLEVFILQNISTFEKKANIALIDINGVYFYVSRKL